MPPCCPVLRYARPLHTGLTWLCCYQKETRARRGGGGERGSERGYRGREEGREEGRGRGGEGEGEGRGRAVGVGGAYLGARSYHPQAGTSITLSAICYASPMRCPVLSYALSSITYAMVGFALCGHPTQHLVLRDERARAVLCKLSG
eukprot:1197138-Rhodomonas_salina.2